MRIYSHVITESDIRDAFTTARATHGQDIYLDGSVRTFRPRSGGNGYEIFAESINGNRASGHAAIGTPPDDRTRAASWEAYGYVMAYLYNIDPAARVGFYKSREDFTLQTSTAYKHDAGGFLATLSTA